MTRVISENRLMGFLLSICFFILFPGISEAVAVDEAVLEKAVKAHVSEMAARQELLNDGETLNVEVIQVPGAPFDFPEIERIEDITLETSSSLERFFSQRALVRIRMADSTGRAREIGAPVKISLGKTVWVAKTNIMPGQTLSKNDFKLVRREIVTDFDKTLGPSFEIEKYAARMMLQPGQILMATHMVKPPAVRRNSMVRIHMKGPSGVKIVLEGKSLEDGQVGQLVRVRGRYSREQFYTAEVIGEGQVRVKL